MKAAEKEYKRMKKLNEISNNKKTSNGESLPEWFDQSIKKEEISEEDEKSLKDMLKEFS